MHLGYKAVIANLSDIYAMNATPTQILISLAFSNRFSLEALDEFYEGVYAACDKYGSGPGRRRYFFFPKRIYYFDHSYRRSNAR